MVPGSRPISKSTPLTEGKLEKCYGKTSTNSLTTCTDETVRSLLLSKVMLAKNVLATLRIIFLPFNAIMRLGTLLEVALSYAFSFLVK